MAETYAPHWSPYVTATIEEDDPNAESRGRPTYKIRARCSSCGAEWRSLCVSGAPRQTVGKFALEHRHNDSW
jgi:hypothetical protein